MHRLVAKSTVEEKVRKLCQADVTGLMVRGLAGFGNLPGNAMSGSVGSGQVWEC